MKIVYLGSDIAMPVLRALKESKHEILAIVCQPDKPNARNNKVEICETKKFALENGIKVLQYKKIRAEGVEDLKALNPDLLISAAYGQIISQEIIDIPKITTLNVHPSLLPKYRGTSPIITSILNGDKETGVSIMQMVFEVDAGPTYQIEKVKIGENETAGELSERLFNLGAKMLLETIDKIEKGEAVLKQQNHEEATYCNMIKKENAKLDFSKSCEELSNMVRAYNPSPVAFFEYQDASYKVFESSYALTNRDEYNRICEYVNKKDFALGEIVYSRVKPFGLVIRCKNGFFMPKTIQAPNGKVMDIKSYLNGKSFNEGEII